MPLQDISGQAYTDLIGQQLTEERASKTSIEQRGTAVITTSGTLVTLLLAIAALVTSGKALTLGTLPKLPLGLSLVAFVIAAILGILTNFPRSSYQEAKLDDIQPLVDSSAEWKASFAVGSQDTAAASLAILRALRAVNKDKVEWLRMAMYAEIAAIGLLAVAAILALFQVGSQAAPYLRVTTSDQTVCGALIKGNSGTLTIDDQFRHEVRSVKAGDVRAESIVQDCSQ
jgi:hypothetical protein